MREPAHHPARATSPEEPTHSVLTRGANRTTRRSGRRNPWVKQATYAERTVGNSAYTITLNARTQAGSPWGVGPYDIRRDAVTPATLEPLLTPIGAQQHYHFQFSDAPLPTDACGCVELAIP